MEYEWSHLLGQNAEKKNYHSDIPLIFGFGGSFESFMEMFLKSKWSYFGQKPEENLSEGNFSFLFVFGVIICISDFWKGFWNHNGHIFGSQKAEEN